MKGMLRISLFIFLSISACTLQAQYWVENFDTYPGVSQTKKWGYQFKHTTLASGPASIENQSLLTDTMAAGNANSFTTGYFLLDNKSYFVDFEYKTNAQLSTPSLKVVL
jgi:hypothetical protein